MRVRTWSACVALAWGILLIVTAAGPSGSLRPAQANTRTANTTSSTSSTSSTTSSTTNDTIQPTLSSSAATTLTSGVAATLTSSLPAAAHGAVAAGPHAAAPAAAARPAARLEARTGTAAWTGTVARTETGAYVVRPGDTLSGIAAALGTPGGWPALYAANRKVIGADPNAIQPGTVLAVPGAASSGSPALHLTTTPAKAPSPPASARPPAPAPTMAPTSARPPASARPSAATPARAPASARPPAATPAHRAGHAPSAQPPSIGGLPRWLDIVLAATGLLIATAFLTEPALAIARRRRAPRPPDDPRIVLADYERLVVTHSRQDGTVYVLRPPGADPEAILLAARLVLAQDRYEELAGHLGVPAHWPRE